VGARPDHPPLPGVAIYRSTLLAGSETFVRNQALALVRHRPLFVGLHRKAGLALPPEQTVVLNPGGLAGRLRELAYVRGGVPGRLSAASRRAGVRLVHAHFGPDGLQALPLARALAVPLVVTLHGYDATSWDESLVRRGGTSRAFVEHRQRLVEGAAQFIAVSGFVRDELLRRGFPAEKVRVHRIGVPVGAAPRSGEREAMVLFVGRLAEKKGVRDLLEAMRAVPAAHLVLVGDGPLRAELEREVHRRRLRAEFAGWRTPEQVREWMLRARVLCVPSRRAPDGDAEGLGQVILEAAAVGTPTVGYRHGGIPEATRDGVTGLLADEGDVGGLGSRLAAVLGDDALWERLSAAGRHHVETEFDLGRQTARLEQLYDEVDAAQEATRGRRRSISAASRARSSQAVRNALRRTPR